MAWNTREGHHHVVAAEGGEVCTAHADEVHAQQHFILLQGRGKRRIHHRSRSCTLNLKCSHLSPFRFHVNSLTVTYTLKAPASLNAVSGELIGKRGFSRLATIGPLSLATPAP
jgi:hypothetical protein